MMMARSAAELPQQQILYPSTSCVQPVLLYWFSGFYFSGRICLLYSWVNLSCSDLTRAAVSAAFLEASAFAARCSSAWLTCTISTSVARDSLASATCGVEVLVR